ncbi:MAG: hypothetical protein OXB84_01225 [Halobacteriovoraceae bacterium]|nr:hypothetical protein [Halobacteriovoraceae bacterium]
MNKLVSAIVLFFSLSATGNELEIPAQCDLYKDDSNFSCCIMTYQKKKAAIKAGKIELLKYTDSIQFEFYARRSSMTEDISEVEEFLGVYFDFASWPFYAESSERIYYQESIGVPEQFDLDLNSMEHRLKYTIISYAMNASVPIQIQESSRYEKRATPAPGALVSYDFALSPSSDYPISGLRDKQGVVHLTRDETRENLMLFLKFEIDPGVIANIRPKIVIESIENAFEDLLKGMMNIDYGCERHTKENNIDKTATEN